MGQRAQQEADRADAEGVPQPASGGRAEGPDDVSGSARQRLMWDEPKGLKILQITDGISNTIGLVEADDDRAVTWSKPEDMTIDPKNPITGLLGHYTEGFHAALADGSVRFIKKSIDPKMLWALFTRDGGEVTEFPK